MNLDCTIENVRFELLDTVPLLRSAIVSRVYKYLTSSILQESIQAKCFLLSVAFKLFSPEALDAWTEPIKPCRLTLHSPMRPDGLDQGYKNRPILFKFGENRRNRTGPNLKTVENIVHCFKISEKDKNQEKICKKLDQILRLRVNFFL
jgi:hypothetical protein